RAKRLPMQRLGLHPEALQQDGERANRVGFFLQLENLELTKEVAKAVLRESKIVVRRVVNRKQEPCRQEQLTAGNQDTKDLVNRALRLRKMLENLGAQDDLEGGIAD